MDSTGNLTRGHRPGAATAVWLALVLFPGPFTGWGGNQETAPLPRSPGQFELNRAAMGVQLRIVVWCDDPDQAERGLKAAARRVDALNQVLSNYRQDSEISMVSRRLVEGPVEVSCELWTLLCCAREIHELSNGRFDVTMAPLTDLWREARRTGQLPSPGSIARARAICGMPALCFHPGSRSLSTVGQPVRFDFGGIGKGFAADQALQVLRAQGIRAALVDLGGDLAIGDPPPGRAGWRIGLSGEQSSAGSGGLLELANCGIATSGDQFQFVEIDGRRYSHLVDPTTGMGMEGSSRVTVVANNATRADAWASVFSLLKPQAALALARAQPECELHGTYQDDPGPTVTVTSPGFPDRKSR